jgi:hypothetical protein
MSALEFLLLVDTAIGVVAGIWGIAWARTAADAGRRCWGRRLFVMTLFLLGAGAMAAAWHQADGLVPVGLSAGLLVVGMLWEGPENRRPAAAPISVGEER